MNDVFHALGEPTRRTILGQLRARGPLTIREISDELPMSRQAATKHLRVLEGANLVESWTEGRTRVHRLAPDPLREVSDWLAPYEAAWDARLQRLKRHVDGSGPGAGTKGRDE